MSERLPEKNGRYECGVVYRPPSSYFKDEVYFSQDNGWHTQGKVVCWRLSTPLPEDV